MTDTAKILELMQEQNKCLMERIVLLESQMKDLNIRVYGVDMRKIKKAAVICMGCIERQPNQLAHMDVGGCLHYMEE